MGKLRYQPIAKESFESEIETRSTSEYKPFPLFLSHRDCVSCPEHAIHQRTRANFGDHVQLTTLIVLLLANICGIAALHFYPRHSGAMIMPNLRIANQFLGLETVFTDGAPWLANGTIVTFPWLVQQINSTSPNYVASDDPRRYRTKTFGTISPEDRPLYVSNTVSTITQFKVRDYGMESCAIKLNLLNGSIISSEDRSDFIQRQRDWTSFSGSFDLQVWALDIDQGTWLDPRRLSFNTRPKRKNLSATLNVTGDAESYSQPFPCKADSILSFEISCDDCILDVWQDKQLPAFGLYVEQYPSID